ncbi:conserved hypothetical protein [Talaromyces stipitatus ATCC 10500]|uniref:Zn(2)-C6 fungal-type domain-containing protein n=1 Tax=Talaromyces stipitatus (strain ATCC 10500 / CBS 375.48 / QM 6759 / NRRL 1006) TaxID=441959 RepID=B8MCV7_TALSN|nr:uncharacterized protein TSTA_113090 [Talaromyces stipitatus ATCC 10500]EED17483.1 conserved hypothetical protein [Talaromyces stipitatus ATCC 10500]
METPIKNLPCATCRRRKVRCSKTQPCTNCARAKIDCHYNEDPTGDTSSVNADLLRRLMNLQDSITKLTKGPRNTDQSLHDSSVSGVRVESIINTLEDSLRRLHRINERENQSSHTGKLCFRDAHTRYIKETFWAGLYDEVESLSFLLDKAAPERRLQDPTSLFIQPQQFLDLGMYITPRKVSDFLINHYLKNVDPFIRLFHKPRFRLDLDQFYRQEESFVSQRGEFETLLSSIYAFSVHSLHEEDVLVYFAESKEIVINRYITTTRRGLERISILSTHSLTALTTFALYITLLSEIDISGLEWTSLSGLSLNIATRLGIHKDGEAFGLSPYAVEIRRRLWHYLCMINVRALQVHGIEPFPVSAFEVNATKLPQNSPDIAWDACEFSRKLPVAISGWTEMVPVLVSYKLSALERTMLETNIPEHGSEEAYLAKCDQVLQDAKSEILVYYSQNLLDKPIHRITKDLMDLTFQYLWFIARRSLLKHRIWATCELRRELFRKALHISEMARSLQGVYSAHYWDWVFHSFYETTKWHLASTILIYLSQHTEQEDLEVQRSWTQINLIFGQRRDDQSVLWKPLLALKREAEIRRDEALGVDNGNALTNNNDDMWQAQSDAAMHGLDPIFGQRVDPEFPLNPDPGILDDFYDQTIDNQAW